MMNYLQNEYTDFHSTLVLLSCIATKTCSPLLTTQVQKAWRLHKHNTVNYSLEFPLKSDNIFTTFVKLKNVIQIQWHHWRGNTGLVSFIFIASNILLCTGHALARAALTRTYTHAPTDLKSRTCNITHSNDRCTCTQGDADITKHS